MLRPSALLLGLLLFPAGAALAQSPGFEDPYKVYIPPAPNYWGYGSAIGDVIRAQGEFLIDIQRVNLMQQQLIREKLTTRKAQLEHWDWEHKFFARVYEERKELAHDVELRRIVSDARPQEIDSGAALNSLLKELIQASDQLSAGTSHAVDPEWLPHLHVNCVNGNSGLLKGDKVAWPLLVLGRSDLSGERTEIEQLLNKAKAAAIRGDTPAVQLIDLRRRVDQLEGRLRDERRTGGVDDWRPGQYVAALRSLNELKDSLAILERPDAATYLNPLQGKDVVELVKYMKGNGLTFAPATWGDERFYTALYYVMRDELKQAGGVPQRKDQ
ncbi:MAG TPA: hypothetical protein VJ739_12680 [Gemmataceae bacterium]|nr:hypothetical protein [Gemmataceae bacterium]